MEDDAFMRLAGYALGNTAAIYPATPAQFSTEPAQLDQSAVDLFGPQSWQNISQAHQTHSAPPPQPQPARGESATIDSFSNEFPPPPQEAPGPTTPTQPAPTQFAPPAVSPDAPPILEQQAVQSKVSPNISQAAEPTNSLRADAADNVTQLAAQPAEAPLERLGELPCPQTHGTALQENAQPSSDANGQAAARAFASNLTTNVSPEPLHSAQPSSFPQPAESTTASGQPSGQAPFVHPNGADPPGNKTEATVSQVNADAFEGADSSSHQAFFASPRSVRNTAPSLQSSPLHSHQTSSAHALSTPEVTSEDKTQAPSMQPLGQQKSLPGLVAGHSENRPEGAAAESVTQNIAPPTAMEDADVKSASAANEKDPASAVEPLNSQHLSENKPVVGQSPNPSPTATNDLVAAIADQNEWPYTPKVEPSSSPLRQRRQIGTLEPVQPVESSMHHGDSQKQVSGQAAFGRNPQPQNPPTRQSGLPQQQSSLDAVGRELRSQDAPLTGPSQNLNNSQAAAIPTHSNTAHPTHPNILNQHILSDVQARPAQDFQARAASSPNHTTSSKTTPSARLFPSEPAENQPQPSQAKQPSQLAHTEPFQFGTKNVGLDSDAVTVHSEDHSSENISASSPPNRLEFNDSISRVIRREVTPLDNALSSSEPAKDLSFDARQLTHDAATDSQHELSYAVKGEQPSSSRQSQNQPSQNQPSQNQPSQRQSSQDQPSQNQQIEKPERIRPVEHSIHQENVHKQGPTHAVIERIPQPQTQPPQKSVLSQRQNASDAVIRELSSQGAPLADASQNIDKSRPGEISDHSPTALPNSLTPNAPSEAQTHLAQSPQVKTTTIHHQAASVKTTPNPRGYPSNPTATLPQQPQTAPYSHPVDHRAFPNHLAAQPHTAEQLATHPTTTPPAPPPLTIENRSATAEPTAHDSKRTDISAKTNSTQSLVSGKPLATGGSGDRASERLPSSTQANTKRPPKNRGIESHEIQTGETPNRARERGTGVDVLATDLNASLNASQLRLGEQKTGGESSSPVAQSTREQRSHQPLPKSLRPEKSLSELNLSAQQSKLPAGARQPHPNGSHPIAKFNAPLPVQAPIAAQVDKLPQPQPANHLTHKGTTAHPLSPSTSVEPLSRHSRHSRAAAPHLEGARAVAQHNNSQLPNQQQYRHHPQQSLRNTSFPSRAHGATQSPKQPRQSIDRLNSHASAPPPSASQQVKASSLPSANSYPPGHYPSSANGDHGANGGHGATQNTSQSSHQPDRSLSPSVAAASTPRTHSQRAKDVSEQNATKDLGSQGKDNHAIWGRDNIKPLTDRRVVSRRSFVEKLPQSTNGGAAGENTASPMQTQKNKSGVSQKAVKAPSHPPGISSSDKISRQPNNSVMPGAVPLSHAQPTTPEDSPSVGKNTATFVAQPASILSKAPSLNSQSQRKGRRAGSSASPPSPRVRVNIGRIKLSAPPAKPSRRKVQRPQPTLSLDGYLQQRQGG